MVGDVATSFGQLLKQLAWLPALTSDRTDAAAAGGGAQVFRRLEPGCNLFAKSRDARDLMGGHVSYLSPDPIPSSRLAAYLGVRQTIDVDFVAERLRLWCDRSSDVHPTGFQTSLQHVRFVYVYLEQHMTKLQLEDLVRNHPVVFYPREVLGPTQIVEGW